MKACCFSPPFCCYFPPIGCSYSLFFRSIPYRGKLYPVAGQVVPGSGNPGGSRRLRRANSPTETEKGGLAAANPPVCLSVCSVVCLLSGAGQAVTGCRLPLPCLPCSAFGVTWFSPSSAAPSWWLFPVPVRLRQPRGRDCPACL